jgi:Xaa-Pro aminopeptidase
MGFLNRDRAQELLERADVEALALPFPAETRALQESMVLAIGTALYVRGLGGFQIEEVVVVTREAMSS